MARSDCRSNAGDPVADGRVNRIISDDSPLAYSPAGRLFAR